jgi:predicted RNase H-like HicB family nuclease
MEEYFGPSEIEMREGERVMQYLVVLERTDRNYGAHAPDLPGCVATGQTPEETLQLMLEAMEMHIRGIEEDGLPVPEPTATASYISIAV